MTRTFWWWTTAPRPPPRARSSTISRAITNKPVRYVVNTHFHYDHTDGNSVFGPEVQIIAHEYVRTAIATFDVLNREPFITSQKTAVPARIEALTKQIAAEKDAQKKAALQKDLAAAQTTLNQLKEIKPTPPNVTYSSKLVLYKARAKSSFSSWGAATPAATRWSSCRASGSSAPAI